MEDEIRPSKVLDYSAFEECLFLLNKYKTLLNISKLHFQEYSDIYENDIHIVNKYIYKWCKHEYIYDHFETSLNNIEKIKYCKHCELSLIE